MTFYDLVRLPGDDRYAIRQRNLIEHIFGFGNKYVDFTGSYRWGPKSRYFEYYCVRSRDECLIKLAEIKGQGIVEGYSQWDFTFADRKRVVIDEAQSRAENLAQLAYNAAMCGTSFSEFDRTVDWGSYLYPEEKREAVITHVDLHSTVNNGGKTVKELRSEHEIETLFEFDFCDDANADRVKITFIVPLDEELENALAAVNVLRSIFYGE